MNRRKALSLAGLLPFAAVPMWQIKETPAKLEFREVERRITVVEYSSTHVVEHIPALWVPTRFEGLRYGDIFRYVDAPDKHHRAVSDAIPIATDGNYMINTEIIDAD